jgi:ligand-binding sensor domain-containing protein
MTPFTQRCTQKAAFVILISFLSIATFSSSVFALDPNKRITQYDIRLYQAEHGLPMNDLKVVFQDSKGYIWLGCQEGLVRFDGVRFVLFDKSKYPGLRENFIWDIKEDWEGNLWVATYGGGVSRFDGKTFTTFDTSAGLPHNMVKCILIAKDQTIWFGTEGGLTHLKDGAFTTVRLSGSQLNQEIYALLEDDVGNILVGRRKYGLDVLTNGAISHWPTADGVVRILRRDAHGEIIVWTDVARTYSFRKGRLEESHLFFLPLKHAVNDILKDRDGNTWFCTDGNGIVRHANGKYASLKSENGLPEGHDFFLRGIEDREKNLWFVGDGGLLQMKDNKSVAFGKKEGALTSFGNTVCEDNAGNIWMAFRQGGLEKLNTDTTQRWMVVNGLLSNDVGSVYPAQKGGLWIGTTQGLNYLRDGKLSKPLFDQQRKNFGGSLHIKSLFENNRGELWLGFIGGFLTKFDGEHFETKLLIDSESGESGNITCVFERSNGEVWAGTWKKGLYRLVNGKVHHVTAADGFAADGVNALYEDNEKVLWIATEGHACTATRTANSPISTPAMGFPLIVCFPFWKMINTTCGSAVIAAFFARASNNSTIARTTRLIQSHASLSITSMACGKPSAMAGGSP